MAETMPRPPEATAEPTRLNFVTVDETYDAEQAARDAANARLTQELNEGGRVKRFIKSAWKGGALRDYYEHKYAREAQANIEATGNVYLYKGSTEQGQRAQWATIDRFLHENDEVIHRETGESRERLESDTELSQEIKGLIRRNVEGTLSDSALREEKERLLKAFHEERGDQAFSRGAVQIDNMFDIVDAVKGAISHGESLDDVMRNMTITTGEARAGVRTEARYNRVEKLADKMSRSKVGSLVGPEVVATATTLAASLLRFGSHSVLGAVTKTVAPGLAAGAWAGLRENKRMKDERAQHARERAQGQEIQPGSKRREKLEEARYETANATDLTELLRQHFGEDTSFDSNDAYQAAMNALSAVETRVRLSDQRNIDLISFSDATAVEEERFALDLARAQAKTVAESRLTADMRQQLGIDEHMTLEDIINERSETFLETVETDISQKDKIFKRLKRREVAKAAAKGALIGLAFGAAAQEGIAALSDTRQGFIEQAWGAENKPYEGEMHQTLMHGLAHGSDGDNFSTLHHDPSDTYTKHSVGERGNISVSSDQTLDKNPDGTMTLKDHNGNVLADGLATRQDGVLTEESLQRLNASGVHVEDLSRTVDLPVRYETTQGSLDEFMENHKSDTTKVTRDFWYDNDSAGFDKNEQKLWWGGENNNGMTANGDYQFTVSQMTEGGSSHDGRSLAWQQAAERGELKLAISASGDTQTQVFMIDIKPDGTATIPKDSPAALFFSEHGGQAAFDGKYAEVVRVGGVDENGATQIRPLATEVGNDTVEGRDLPITREIHEKEFRPEYKITSGGYDTQESQATFTEMAPVIPVVPRRPLEQLAKPRRSQPVEGIYYEGASTEKLRQWVSESPDRLRTRREITNADGSKSWVEADGSPVERNVDRERREIAGYLERERANNPEHYARVEKAAADLGPMADTTRVAVCVPAWMEEETIGHFLDEYSKQIAKDGNPIDAGLYEVNVLVNRKTGTPADGTVAAIEQFISDFEATYGGRPNVNYVDVEIDPPNNNVGYARKLVTDAVVMRSVARTGQTGPLYIETEDADVDRLDKKTVANLIDKMDTNPHLDAVRGTADRNPEVLKENDKLFISRRLWDFTETFVRTKDLRDPTNPEWNSTWNRVWMNGWNAGYSAEAYALIDGYDAVSVGEDMRIGEKIGMIRGDGRLPNPEVVGKIGTRSDGSPRRFIAEIELGVPAYAPGQFEDPMVNKLIRENTDEQLMQRIQRVARITPDNQGEFTGLVNGYAKFIRTLTPNQAEAERVTRRVLFWLGFEKSDYTITPKNELEIHSWDNVAQSLDRYRTKHAAVAA